MKKLRDIIPETWTPASKAHKLSDDAFRNSLSAIKHKKTGKVHIAKSKDQSHSDLITTTKSPYSQHHMPNSVWRRGFWSSE
jgi:hypothetical protein